MFNLKKLRANFPIAIKTLFALCCCLGMSVSVNAKQSEVPTSADDVKPILIGQEVPKITLTTPEGKSVSLNALLKEKPTLLSQVGQRYDGLSIEPIPWGASTI